MNRSCRCSHFVVCACSVRVHQESRLSTLGFSRPYGSSSFGLNTLRSGQKEGVEDTTERSPDGLHLAVHPCSCKVAARRALRDHLRMQAFRDGALHRVEDAVHPSAQASLYRTTPHSPIPLRWAHRRLVIQRLHLHVPQYGPSSASAQHAPSPAAPAPARPRPPPAQTRCARSRTGRRRGRPSCACA
jgi:hypothetical protein